MTEDKKFSIYNRIFYYSKDEADRMKKVAEGMSGPNNYQIGTVITEGGVIKPYTSIVNDRSNIKASDAVVVMQGDIRKISYKTPVMN